MLIPPSLKRTRRSPKPFPQPQSPASRGKVTKRAAKKPDLGPCASATKRELAADFKEMGLGHLLPAKKTPGKQSKEKDGPDGPRHMLEKAPDYSQTEPDELDRQLENTTLVEQGHIVPAQLPTNREHKVKLHTGERTRLTTKICRPGNKLILVVSGIPSEIWAA